MSIYRAGPDALVAWVEQLLTVQADQMAQLRANQAKLEQQVQVLTARLQKDSHPHLRFGQG